MKKTIQQRMQAIENAIIDAMMDKFGIVVPEHETCWPWSKWDMVQTDTSDFHIELDRLSGKIIQITEER